MPILISHASTIAPAISIAAHIPTRTAVFLSSSNRRCINLRNSQLLSAIAVE
jgi:hypothetical protein